MKRGWRDEVFQDWKANGESTKSQVILALFRFTQRVSRTPTFPGPVRAVVVVGYKVLTTWVLGVELPPETEVGPGLRLLHPQSIVVNGQTRIGARCVLRVGTTLGNVMHADGSATASPILGDDVELGAGVIVVGSVRIGDGARVGAGAVVIKDVPAGCVAVGNPARVLAPRS